MRFYNSRLVVGVVLILAGILSLLQITGWVTLGNQLHPIVVATAFGLAGLLFLGTLINRRQDWWVLFPGMALCGLAIIITLDACVPQMAWMSGAVFLGMLARSFWLVYATNRHLWWAVIPGGVLTTLAVVTLSDHLTVMNGGTIFFLGLAATFALLYFLPGAAGQTRWAIIPAAVLGLMGLMLMLSMGGLINYLWAIGLIVAGVFLLFRAAPFTRR